MVKFNPKIQSLKKEKGKAEESFVTTPQGKYKIKKMPNGVVVHIMKEPSKEYLKKMKENKEARNKIKGEQEKKRNTEKMIQARMREMAIDQLKKEGKL